MKLNTNSNSYIIVYSAILVVIVAFLLAFIYQALKPMQDANVALDIKKQILYSLNIRGLDGSEAEAKYAEVVKSEPGGSGEFENPFYECEVDGKPVHVLPLKGMGLWGGISGFIALEGDYDTVYGVYFNHESETAGLGAEIKDSQAWQEKFIGKKVHKNGVDGIALSVVKNVTDSETQVDAVTGATLTSNGVSKMLQDCLNDVVKHVESSIMFNPDSCCQKAMDCNKDCKDCKDGKDCKDCKDCKDDKNCCKEGKDCCETKAKEE